MGTGTKDRRRINPHSVAYCVEDAVNRHAADLQAGKAHGEFLVNPQCDHSGETGWQCMMCGWTRSIDIHSPTKPVVPFNWTLPTDSALRKRHPIVSGFLDYFPDATAAVAFLSWAGNEKHNPGQSLHWARGKSMDQEDCIGRHLVERGGVDYIETNDALYEIPHEVALAWRAMAQLQLACEAHGAKKARGAK